MNRKWGMSLAMLVLAAAMSGAAASWAAVDNGVCLDCHGDSSLTRKDGEGSVFVDQKSFQYSVHNINGIGCLDCHTDVGDLDVSQAVPHKTPLAAVNCGGCHEQAASQYRLGVHQKASHKGIIIQCQACHGYHDVVSNENKPVRERENRSCLKCHNPGKYHNWLPQKETHFTYVQCTVCHAPNMPHVIHLRFYDLAKRQFLEPERVLAALGTDFDGFMPMFSRDAKPEEMSADEFENMVFALNRRGLYVGFHAELLSQNDPRVHQVTKVSAKRACADCHAANAPFFDSVAMFFVDQNGGVHQYKLDRKVLESYSVSNFYLPGSGAVSRLRPLDLGGILLVLGAGVGVMLHLAGRAATAPLRKRRHDRKEGEAD